MSSFPKVEPHDSLVKIMDNAWYLTGSVMLMPLVRLVRNMVVLRHNNELTVINSVRVNAEEEAKLEALGTVKHVVKIGGHGMDDPYYLDKYGAKYWVIDEAFAAEKEDVELLTEETVLPIPSAKVFLFRDTNKPEAALLIDRDEGLLITCDSVQHWVPHKLMSPAAKLLTMVMGFRKPAQIGPPWRKLQTPAGGSLKADFERLASLPFQRIIGGHGGLLESGGPEALRATIRREIGYK